ncbi:MAG: hypothetical protein HC814_03340 [Rhodobacteraceae bacterium]|nr:hypothetical protein [Paracoccaceae bacterium]
MNKIAPGNRAFGKKSIRSPGCYKPFETTDDRFRPEIEGKALATLKNRSPERYVVGKFRRAAVKGQHDLARTLSTSGSGRQNVQRFQ